MIIPIIILLKMSCKNTYLNQLDIFQDMDFHNFVALHSILQAADQLYPCITEFLIHHDTV